MAEGNERGVRFVGHYKNQCCPNDCERRAPGCHNVKTCAFWAEHEKERMEAYRKRRMAAAIIGSPEYRER